MSSSTELQQLVDAWAEEVESFCIEANETLDHLEAYGKEPVLDESWLEDLSSSNAPFYFSTDSLESDSELEPEEKHRQLRLNINLTPTEERSFPSSDAIADVLALAHAEDVESWQQAIATVMSSHERLSFTRLLELSKLQPGELLVGLLLGHWILKQQTFYGEIEVFNI